MNIPKATEILATDLIPNYPYAVGEKARAISLAIEALKRVTDWRKGTVLNASLNLPGETE